MGKRKSKGGRNQTQQAEQKLQQKPALSVDTSTASGPGVASPKSGKGPLKMVAAPSSEPAGGWESAAPRPYRVAFTHPDLGIGGAERLIVDAAMGLQSLGHDVTMFTSHHDPSHCFPETNSMLKVSVHGDWLPRSIAGRFHALAAAVRAIWVALVLLWRVHIACQPLWDVIVVDQVSAAVPLLKLTGATVVFYCHFPDLLLAPKGRGLAALYRAPLNWWEQTTTGAAHAVCVNSHFTRGVYRKTFTKLAKEKGTIGHPDVLWPPINVSAYLAYDGPSKEAKAALPSGASTLFVSLNRYERKKNVARAIQAFASVYKETKDPSGLHLVVAGGYDVRVKENVEHAKELAAIVSSSGIPTSSVTFLKSISEDVKLALLSSATALLYTPSNEHFGIVPLEAMAMGTPVIASASGGPLETIVPVHKPHGALPPPPTPSGTKPTGWLCTDDIKQWAAAMGEITAMNSAERAAIGDAGRTRVVELFSLPSFASRLEAFVVSAIEVKTGRRDPGFKKDQ